jgi:hypothetical protein
MEILENFNPTLLLVVGFVLIGLGALRFQLLRRRLLNVQTAPIASASGFVQVKGTSSVGKEGVVQAPLSGRACVWVRITLDAETGPAGARWRNLTQEVLAKDFYLRDGAGGSVHVFPEGAEVRSTNKQTTVIAPGEEASSTLVEYIISQGGTLQEIRDTMSPPGSVRAIEEVIVLGDEVHVVGSAKKDGTESIFRGSPLYVAHDDIQVLAKDGRLFDGRARP